MRNTVVVCLLLLLTPLAVHLAPASGLLHEVGSGRIVPAPTPETVSTGFAYKGTAIGMLADDIRKKLGDPKDRSDAQDLYVFSDDESVQFIYDPAHKVNAIMITFTGKLASAPTPKDVFGEDVPPRPDGRISKMVRYTKAGYWVSYNKIVGEDSMISIAMQKIP